MRPILHAGLSFFRSYLTEAGKHAARNLVWLVVLTVLTQLCSLAQVYVLTKGLGVERFGVLAFALSLQTYLVLLGAGGTRALVVREGLLRPEELATTLGSFVTITGAATLLGAIGLVIAAAVAPVSTNERLLWLLLAVSNVGATIHLQAFYDLRHRQPMSSFIMLVAAATSLCGMLVLYAADQLTLPAVGAVIAIRWLLDAALHAAFFPRYIGPLALRVRAKDVLAMLRSALPVLISIVLGMIPMSAGVFIVRAVHGEEPTAMLGLAQQAAAAGTLLATLGARVLQPHIAGPYGRTRRFLLQAFLFCCLYFGGIGLVLSLFGATVISALLPDYRAAIGPMTIMLAAMAIRATAGVGMYYLIVMHRERLLLAVNTVIAAVFLGGCLFLVAPYGATGAAWSTLMSVAAGFVCVAFLGTRLFQARN